MMTNVPVPVTYRSRWLAAVFVLAALIFQGVWLGFPGMFVSLGLLIAFGAWWVTPWRLPAGLRRVYWLGLVLFFGHVAEEYFTGLYEALPELFGRAPWTPSEYLSFNTVWLLIFLAAATFLDESRPITGLIVLFFAAIGGVANGVVHLLLVWRQGGYFPGAWTAPLVLAVGVWMLRSLYREESPGD